VCALFCVCVRHKFSKSKKKSLLSFLHPCLLDTAGNSSSTPTGV
jgi:hypothetical protein